MADPHIVIIGGGFGGLYAARALRGAPVARDAASIAATITSSSRCSTRWRLAALSPGDIASPIRWILRAPANVEVLLAEVVGIDTARQAADARRRRSSTTTT